MIGIYPSFTKEDIGSEKLSNLHKVLQFVSGEAGTKPVLGLWDQCSFLCTNVFF